MHLHSVVLDYLQFEFQMDQTSFTLHEINSIIDDLMEQTNSTVIKFVSASDPSKHLVVAIQNQSNLILENILNLDDCKYIETETLQYLLVTYDKNSETLLIQDLSELLLTITHNQFLLINGFCKMI